MKKFKIKFDPILYWKTSIIIFLCLLIALFALNSYILIQTRRQIRSYGESSFEFTPQKVNKTLLESVIEDIKYKKTIFENNLFRKPQIRDPSGSI